MKENLNKARVIVDDSGFFVFTHTPAIQHTHSNKPGKVSSYPAQYVPADAPQFVFCSHKATHLYPCDAYPDGMGVVK